MSKLMNCARIPINLLMWPIHHELWPIVLVNWLILGLLWTIRLAHSGFPSLNARSATNKSLNALELCPDIEKLR